MSIEQAIDELIVILARPVSPAEHEDGWRQPTKEAARQYFEDLLQRLKSGQELPPLNIARSLDHSGVIGGSLLEKIATVSNKLRKLKN